MLFLLLPVGGWLPDSRDRNPTPLLHSLPTPEVITSVPPSPLYACHQVPLPGSQVLGVGVCFQWDRRCGRGCLWSSLHLPPAENCQTDHGGMEKRSQNDRRAFGVLIGGWGMSDPEDEPLSPTPTPLFLPHPAPFHSQTSSLQLRTEGTFQCNCSPRHFAGGPWGGEAVTLTRVSG